MTKRTPGPSTPLSCGCMVGHELQSPYFPIRHCPLHAAAGELLKILKQTVINLEDYLDPNGEFEWSEAGGRTIVKDLEAAIAKAEGKP